MTAPGTTVTVTTNGTPPVTVPANTGTLFAVGMAQRGPVGVPVLLTQLTDFGSPTSASVGIFGPRTTVSASSYDTADVFFAPGYGSQMYFSRVVGPAATAATVTLKDSSAASSISVSANGPGTDGNNLSVAVIAGTVTSSFVLQISYSGTVVETSPPLLTVADAVNWGTVASPLSTASTGSKWVKIAAIGANPPAVVAATALTGGTDDNSNASDSQYTSALTAFVGLGLGPGQVSACGRTTTATQSALGAHAQANNRVAALDLAAGSASTVATAAASTLTALVTAGVDPSYCAAFTPFNWPGPISTTLVPPAVRQVCGSAGFAALCAKNDSNPDNDCNIAAAGNAGIVAQALSVPYTYSTADRSTLDAAGVCPFIVHNGAIMLYGWSTMSTDPNWVDLSYSRFRMQLVNDATAIADKYVFAQIDGAGHTIAAFNGDLSAMLLGYYAKGSLYGASAAAAFTVNTGPSVNTPTTIAARQLIADIVYIDSPSAHTVTVTLVKDLVGATV